MEELKKCPFVAGKQQQARKRDCRTDNHMDVVG